MRLKTVFLFLLPVLFLLMTFSSQVFAMGVLPKLPVKKPPIKTDPPWVDKDPVNPNPPSAAEPVSLILIGMGASGAVGYYLGKKKNKDL